MLAKALCLVAVLIIAAHAAETYTDAATTAVADVGPESMVSLAETGSSMLRRRLDSFALDRVDFHDDEDALDLYEEEQADSKHRRRDRRRRRRERAAKRIEEQQLADEAEMDREERAHAQARSFRQKKKLEQKKKEAARRAALAKKGVTFEARGKTKLHGEETEEQRKRLEKAVKQSKKDKELYKKTLKLEKQVKRHNAIAKDLEAKAALEDAAHNQNKVEGKWAKRDRSTAYAVEAGVSKVTSYQGQLETEDLHADNRFWDAYYGRKHNSGAKVKNDVKHESLDRMVKNLQQGKETPVKKVDRSIELYKAAHVASFTEAYGQGEVKMLDNNLKEDGDKYIQFFQELN